MVGLIKTSVTVYTIHTSALYIFISPELTLAQFSTPLMPHSVLECSANGPVFTCGQRKHINTHISIWIWNTMTKIYTVTISTEFNGHTLMEMS